MEGVKTIKVEFTEQSKAVVANTKLEVVGENITKEEVLAEAKELFKQAFEFSKQKTMEKVN